LCHIQSQEVLSFQPDDQAVFARFMNGDCERSGSEWVELSGLEIDLLSEKGIPPNGCLFLGRRRNQGILGQPIFA
jgi:hypothetical protein